MLNHIESILRHIHDKALRQLLKNGEVEPVIFGFQTPEDGTMKVHTYNVSGLMNSQDNKEVVRMMMEEAIQQERIDLVMLVTEAWIVKVKELDIAKDEVLKIRPSEHPDKEEIVMVNIMTKTKQLLASAAVHRDPVKLDEFEINVIDGESEGTLVRDKEDTPNIH